MHSPPQVQARTSQNLAKWELIVSSTAEETTAPEDTIDEEENVNLRLEALKNLQEELERQAMLGKIWIQWEDSRMLQMGHTVE